MVLTLGSPWKLTQRFLVFSVQAVPSKQSAASSQGFWFLFDIDCGWAFLKYSKNELVEKGGFRNDVRNTKPFPSYEAKGARPGLCPARRTPRPVGALGGGRGPGCPLHHGQLQSPPANRRASGWSSRSPRPQHSEWTRVDVYCPLFAGDVFFWNQAMHL